MKKQILVLVIGRINLDASLIPPLKAIIPSLQLVSLVKLYTSMNVEITGQNLYENLVKHLQEQSGICSINDTLHNILNNESLKRQNFRVCLLGNESVDWDVIMNFKRRKIVIDTGGSNPLLPQISFVTGGINKKVTDSNMVKCFLCCFSLSTNLRNKFKFQQDSTIQFFLYCKCCNPPKLLKNDLMLCSICMAPYCSSKEYRPQKCKVCIQIFDQ